MDNDIGGKGEAGPPSSFLGGRQQPLQLSYKKRVFSTERLRHTQPLLNASKPMSTL